MEEAIIPKIGKVAKDSGFIALEYSSDNLFKKGMNGVNSIFSTGDRKVEFISFADNTIANVKSAMGYPAYYPVYPVNYQKPAKAVLMDLDGTSVRNKGQN